MRIEKTIDKNIYTRIMRIRYSNRSEIEQSLSQLFISVGYL